jgi:hypothetical protein
MLKNVRTYHGADAGGPGREGSVFAQDDLISRAIQLLARTRAEEFDRTFPGAMDHGEWLVHPEHTRESNQHALDCYAASRLTAKVLGVELERDQARDRGGHDADLRELAILSSGDWFARVNELFTEALAQRFRARGTYDGETLAI